MSSLHPGHAHSHDTHDHDHEHHHAHPALVAARPADPAFSLLRLSVWERLAGAAALSAGLWLAVWWAMS